MDSSGSRGHSNSSNNTNSDQARFECLLSGGMDSKLCTYPVNDYDVSRPTWHLPVPTRDIVQSSANGRIACVQHDHHS